MKLYVIAGHGAGDPGAVGFGYNEAECVRRLAKKIKELGGDDVVLGDLNKNYYASNEISKLTIPKNYQLLELHMDSASSTAKGGHVIIQSSFNADAYDKALASNISKIFPGRANTIVKRSDLANPNRAKAKGYPYRLLEVCFITNQNDLNYFNNHLDEVASAILKSFNISVKTQNNNNNNNNGGTTMSVWNEVLTTVDGGKMTAAAMLAWTLKNTERNYGYLKDHESATGDKTTGDMRTRIEYIDKRVREQETKLNSINNKLDEILKKL